ncbi:MAG TPA: hypothetical protein DD637_05905 [Verrucomicrobia bacterium]|nr:hypothetical protein [Verrucomicrobiota bacterium]HCG19462.1 hypothetical protein [Verrucomicrobiota bacterium]
MKIVLFFQSTSQKSWRLKLSGAYRFARENDWFIQVIDIYSKPRDIRRALERWNPAGCLVDRALAQGNPPDLLFGDLPTVYLDQAPTRTPCAHPALIHDSASEARLAGSELLRLDCASYAYIGLQRGYFWDRERQTEFRRLCAENGKGLTILPHRNLRAAIAALPKPCGILAANDSCAMDIWPVAASLGLDIPGDIAVAGIDNDEMYAESVTPGLTSAEPDFEGAGYRLAQMLADEMDRPSPRADTPATQTYGALRLVRRGSTNRLPDGNPRIERALEHIRRHALRSGFTTDEVVAVIGGPRRTATELFRKATGTSILEAIQARRFEEVLRLLRNPNQQIEPIAGLCGYSAPSFLKRLFKSRTGLSMREWRKRNADPSD